MKLSIVILAAGQGKRMKSALPKVLQPLAGTPLLKHVVDTARALDPERIVVVYGHGGDQVRARLQGESLEWALQAEQLGTGHAVLQGMPTIPDDHLVLVLYGDVPLTRPSTLKALIAQANSATMSLLSVNMQDPSGYGRIIRDSNGRAIAIVEHKDATPAQIKIREVNTGLMAVPAAQLRSWLQGLRNDNAQGEYYLTDVVALAVQHGVAVNAVIAETEIEVMGVNDKVQLADVEAGLRRRRARDLMLAGATLADPARIDIRGELVCGRDVAIDVNCIFEGRVALGDGVKIGANCILRDVSVGAGSEVMPFTLVEEAAIGANARIGPYARIRPGAQLGDDVHIGNFVEVKASTFGRGSKANHLAYIGDTSVGSGVNIGAGTITCNYDGANKHRTVIEDDVHIGSDVQLVAPVTVGKGATIGAGATIVKDVPPGGLTLTEAKQVTQPGWQRPRKK